MSAVPVEAAADEMESIDLAIIDLLRRRQALAVHLPRDTGPGSMLPLAFRVDEVVARYRSALGSRGELVARAVLNLSRVGRVHHK